MATIIGTIGGDTITGGFVSAGVTGGAPGFDADSIVGQSGDDFLEGGFGANTLQGGIGNDTVAYAGFSNDILDGGTGEDILLLLLGAAPFQIRLSLSGGAQNVGTATPTLISIERFIIEAGSGHDYLDAGAGALRDNLFGGGGNDTLFGGGGIDLLDGQDGADSLDAGVGDDAGYGRDGADTLDGGDGNDTLYGDGNSDLLLGEDGTDQITGGTGNDTLLGGSGADTLSGAFGVAPGLVPYEDLVFGEAGNDFIYITGNDTIFGGGGNDTISGATPSSEIGIIPRTSLAGGAGDDLIEALRHGSDHDRLMGGTGNDTLVTEHGEDTLEGGDGNDRLVVSTVNFGSDNVVDGGSGFDVVAADLAEADGAFVRLTGPDSLILRHSAEANLAVCYRVEVLRIFGGRYGDTLLGLSSNDTLDGFLGPDSLEGNDGNDSLLGDTMGQATFLGGKGNDTIAGSGSADGGAGDDFIDLHTGTAIGGDGNDTIRGASSEVYGDAGNDELLVRGDAVIVSAGDGNDTVTLYSLDLSILSADGGAGADLLWVAVSSFDMLWFRGGSDGSAVVRRAGTFIDLSGFERVVATGGDQVDRLIGFGGADALFGRGGNDVMLGGAGNDFLQGGLGADRMTGQTGADTFQWLHWNEGGDVLVDFVAVDDTIEVEAAGFGGGLVAGALPGARFVANTTGLATAAFGQFIYETDIGRLWWDLNGTAAGGRVAIATMVGAPTVTAADIVVI